MAKVRVKKAAELFHTDVMGFARMTGYAKTALYTLFETRNPPCNENRMRATILSLKDKSDELYLRDVARAKIDKQEREEYLNAICRHVHIDDVVEQH